MEFEFRWYLKIHELNKAILSFSGQEHLNHPYLFSEKQVANWPGDIYAYPLYYSTESVPYEN
jgi:hypothetical protein